MRASDIAALLDAITPPEDDTSTALVRPLPGVDGAFVGWEHPRSTVLILPPQPRSCPEIRLRNLELLPHARVCLRVAGGEEDEFHDAVVLRCVIDDPGLKLAFEHVVAVLCNWLEEDGALDLSVQIPSLERLFSAFQQSAVTTVVGLWAELALIACADEPQLAAEAWRDRPQAVFDFRDVGSALEVKASRDVARDHWISLDQVRAGRFVAAEIASFVVTEVDDGASIVDLLEIALTRLRRQPPLQRKLVEVTTRTLGRDLARATRDRFDLDAAFASLRFVALGDVPQGTFDPGVLEARWKAPLEHLRWRKQPSLSGLAPTAERLRRL